jgi:hypothetical protein
MTARAVDPADFPGAFAYEHTDVTPDVTLTAWRRSRAQHPRRRRTLRALLRRLRGDRSARPGSPR